MESGHERSTCYERVERDRGRVTWLGQEGGGFDFGVIRKNGKGLKREASAAEVFWPGGKGEV